MCSHVVNDQWQEAAWDSFEEAVELGNWAQAEAIMADTRDNGFETLWEEMFKSYNFHRFDDQ